MTTTLLANFIVFEGIDGSGTTTQLKLLSERLESTGVPHFATSEPTRGPVGRLIHGVLAGYETLDARSLALLFAADRNEHLYHGEQSIDSQLKKNKLVICDRYLFSSLAYQSVDCEFDFISSINNRFPLPEYVFFIDTPLEISARRREDRDERQIFETHEYQKKVMELYEKSFAAFSHTPMRLVRLNGSKEKHEILEEVWKFVSGLPIVKG
jgi:dTMP kinase